MKRTTRRASLTEIGRDYYERCVQILQGLEEADEAAGAQQATPRGQARLLPPGHPAVRLPDRPWHDSKRTVSALSDVGVWRMVRPSGSGNSSFAGKRPEWQILRKGIGPEG
jgi:hypothetical protein